LYEGRGESIQIHPGIRLQAIKAQNILEKFTMDSNSYGFFP